MSGIENEGGIEGRTFSIIRVCKPSVLCVHDDVMRVFCKYLVHFCYVFID